MTRVAKAADVLSEVVDGRAVVSDAAGREVITLNPTGTVVWEALDRTSDRDVLAAEIVGRYPGIGAERAAADVDAFLDQLLEAGLVVPVAEP